MTFKHKLSSRLALLKDRVVLASLAGLVTAATVACELPVRATDPGSTIADLLVSPKPLTLRQNATADFTAVGFMSTGDSASVAVSWSVTAGSIIDTSSNGKRHYGHYKAGPNPGQYKVVATGSPGGVSDTAVVTGTLAPVAAGSGAPTAAAPPGGAAAPRQAPATHSPGHGLAGRTGARAQEPAPPRSRRRARDRAVRPALRSPSCRWHRSRSPRHRRACRSVRPCSSRPRRRTRTGIRCRVAP